MKNAFYFTLKALFVIKIFKFFSWLFGYVGKRLDEKDQINFKIYDVTTCLTNICNTHLPISQEVKAINQAMKFGQLIKYNMRNIFFFEKSYTKCGRETIPRLFSKNSKLSISSDQYSKVLHILFLLFAKWRTIESNWN